MNRKIVVAAGFAAISLAACSSQAKAVAVSKPRTPTTCTIQFMEASPNASGFDEFYWSWKQGPDTSCAKNIATIRGQYSTWTLTIANSVPSEETFGCGAGGVSVYDDPSNVDLGIDDNMCTSISTMSLSGVQAART